MDAMLPGKPTHKPEPPKVETVRVPVELLRRCLDDLTFFRRNGLGVPTPGQLPRDIDELRDLLAAQ